MKHEYKELRAMNDNIEVRAYLNKMSKQSLVDYYFKNLPTATDKTRYLRKTKEQLVNMILNHYTDIRRNEAMNNIKV